LFRDGLTANSNATAGFSTFAVHYCVQPLLPIFSAEFRVSPAASSLALSLSTGLLAIGLLMAGPLSEVAGRKPVMAGSLFTSARACSGLPADGSGRDMGGPVSPAS
jgi:YNFM family putative membrane transporter